MLAQINPFGVSPAAVDPKLNAKEPAARGGCDIHIDNGVAHFKIFQDRRAAIEKDALAALIVRRLGLPFKLPARRIRRNRNRLWNLGISGAKNEKRESTKREVSHCFRSLVELKWLLCCLNAGVVI